MANIPLHVRITSSLFSVVGYKLLPCLSRFFWLLHFESTLHIRDTSPFLRYVYCSIFFLSFGGRSTPVAYEVPKLGVQWELQPPASTTATATATLDLSCICDLYHSARQCCILNPLIGARDWTHILMDTVLSHSGNSGTTVSKLRFVFAFPRQCLLSSRSFEHWRGPIHQFIILWIVLGVSYLRNRLNQGHNDFTLRCFWSGVIWGFISRPVTWFEFSSMCSKLCGLQFLWAFAYG